MSPEKKACCGPLPVKLVFACSGASDVGGITDQAARRITASRAGFMSCTAGVAARIPDILERIGIAPCVLVLDGCEKECARLCLEGAGVTRYHHLQLGRDMGMEKGKVTDKEGAVAAVASRGISVLGSS